MGRQLETDIGRGNPVATALQHSGTHGFLENPDIAAQRVLGEARTFGCLRLRADIDDGGELHEVAWIDNHTKMLYLDYFFEMN